MNLSTDNINETRKAITVTIPSEVIKNEEAKLLQETAQKVKLPGFRPGKVPVQLLKTKFAKGLNAELKEKIIVAAHQFIINTAGLDLYAIIKVDIQNDNVSEEEDAVLTFLVDVKPKFELPEYKNIPVLAPIIEVSEKEIEQALQTVLKEHSEFNVTDKAAQKGDYVKLSYEGKIDNQPIAELIPRRTIYGTQKSTWEEAGAENVPGVPAVIQGIIGMKAGEHKNVSMHFPQNFEISELAGKDATYDITVEEVRNLVLPEINENLLKKLQVENLDQLKKQIKEGITKHKSNESKNLIMNKVIEYLVNNVASVVPESSVKDEEDSLIRLFMQRMIGSGLSQAQIESKKDEIIETAQHDAPGRAKLHMILDAIAKKENIQIDEQDLNSRIMFEAYNLRMKPQKFVNDLKKDQRSINEFRQSTLFHKVLDFLCKESKVEFKGSGSENS